MQYNHSDGVPASFINAIFKKNSSVDIGYERFSLKSLLGSGGLGVVVRAQKRSGEYVALKFLYREEDSEGTSDSFERFKREIRATKLVGDISDYCVRVYECGEYELENGTQAPFFSMEYVPGISLQDLLFLRETPFSAREIYVIASQIAEALADIHDKGIVHRDIKPSNILFDETRKILKVTDFGISRDISASMEATSPLPDGRPAILGTLSYLSRYYFDTVHITATDVVEDGFDTYLLKSTGERVYKENDGDFYSVYKGKKLDLSVLASTILFQLATGQNPFARSSFPGVITDIMNGYKLDIKNHFRKYPHHFHPDIRRNQSFLTHLSRIIRKGIAPNRQQSYSSAHELQNDLDKAIKAVTRSSFSKADRQGIMTSLLGRTLVEEYDKSVTRLEHDLQSGRIFAQPDNVSRIALLYKLKKSERLMACIESLRSRTAVIVSSDRPPQRESQFLYTLWDKLERFGIDETYRYYTTKLKDIVATMKKDFDIDGQ
jgi:serine/threonine protein kinase